MVSDRDLEVKVNNPLKIKTIAEAKINIDEISADILQSTKSRPNI